MQMLYGLQHFMILKKWRIVRLLTGLVRKVSAVVKFTTLITRIIVVSFNFP